MEYINKIELRGNVGNVRIQNVSGRNVAKITLATNIAYKSSDGCPVIETTWHNVTAWEGENVKNLESITKGSKIHVIGRIRQQRYTNADGETRYMYDVLASSLEQIASDESLNSQ